MSPLERDEDEGAPPPWGVHPLPSEGSASFRLGPLTLWIQARGSEVWLAYRRAEDEAPGHEDGEPADDDWARWAVVGDPSEVSLSPVFPDRPVVVKPEVPFQLLKGADARIYVRVPLWVRISLPSEEDRTLVELPTMVLSDTWFGTFQEGELAYYLPTTARREMRPELFQPYRAACPFLLKNRSEENLPVEKIALRVVHLSIFGEEGRLWSDQVTVEYRGDEEGSDLRMPGRPPGEAAEALLVTPPRSPLSLSFRARTFARFKSLPGLGHTL